MRGPYNPGRRAFLGAAMLCAVVGLQGCSAIPGLRRVEPFQIAGNLYYVGAGDVTSFLLTGPEGHVLIDGGYRNTAEAILDNIDELGFEITDVEVLLNSHAHFDHAGGLRTLQEASGAELWISEADADVIEAGGLGDRALRWLRYLGLLGITKFPAPSVDHRFEDGQTIRLGPLELTAHVTAGHTPGCTSWSFKVREGDRTLDAVNICSLKRLPFVSLVEPETYPGIRADFERSFSTLRGLPAELFLASHASRFRLKRKRRQRSTATNPVDPFIDREGYLAYIDRAEEKFDRALSRQQ